MELARVSSSSSTGRSVAASAAGRTLIVQPRVIYASAQEARMAGALSGMAVVDISRSVAGAWCTRLLAAMGADVVLFEQEGGHPLRAIRPASNEGSALARYLLAGKRTLDGDVEEASGHPAFESLARGADIVVSSFTSGELQRSGLDLARVARASAVLAHITPHGLWGPLSDLAGNELTDAAWSGWASINGLAGREPLKPSGWQSSYCAGTAACAAILAALVRRETTGVGASIDIAEIEVMAAACAPAVLREQYTGQALQRPPRQDVTNGPVEVADGHFALTLSRGHFWREAMNLLGLTDLAEDPRWETGWYRQANKHLYVERVETAMRGWTRQRLFEELAVRRVVAGPVLSIEELLANEHLEARRFWSDEAERLPGAPFKMTETPLAMGALPQAQPEGEPARAARDGRDQGIVSGEAPLAGVCGIVLTQAWAGTFCTELLAFLGADVIQVEVTKRLDSWRGSYDAPMPAALADAATARHAWNCNPLYNSVNLGKRCVTLDLANPEGLAVFRRLVAHADFVAENFSPRVLKNLGIGYEELAAIKPGVVLCSLSAYGQTGPWANVPGIGGTIEPTSGMSALLGYPGGPPLNSGQMYPDAAAGLLGATAIAAALLHRARTGEGQRIDLSMQEANLCFIGEAVAEFAMTGRQPARAGNRMPHLAPSAIVADSGGDRSLAIGCGSDAEWQALCAVVGDLDASLDFAGRRLAAAAIEARIAEWTAGMERDEAVAELSRAGVPAAPVLSPSEVGQLEHLRERGVAVSVEHPEAGNWTQIASPFHFTGWTPAAPSAAPCLGQHNEEVFGELLGMTSDEYGALAARGVSGTERPD
jgi:crotonobetainyl-CoA:carnitine CoA-transferase CaiB-like acyl-CoA transferase